MLHDPEAYPDSKAFKPERYIKNGKIDPSVRDPLTIAFGFGRRYVISELSEIASGSNTLCRICPGRYLAQGSLFMTIASTLHTFNVHPILDEKGETIDPFSSVVSGVVSYVLFITPNTSRTCSPYPQISREGAMQVRASLRERKETH